MTPNNVNTSLAALTQLDFDMYPDRRLTAAIKETTKDLKSEKKGEVLNSEMLKKKYFFFFWLLRLLTPKEISKC